MRLMMVVAVVGASWLLAVPGTAFGSPIPISIAALLRSEFRLG